MTKKLSRYIVSREETGRLVISKRRSAHPPKGERVIISADVERFSDVNIVRPAVRPNKKTESAIRRAVRETMKQKPLGQS